jgi:DNA-binding PadR family transcriptional regulator
MNQDSQRSLAEAAGLFDVLIHLHVLHAASKSPVSAAQLVELLTQRGYKVSKQAMSALLRRFERRGWLRAHKARKGTARLFQATREGKIALQKSRNLVSALFMEMSSEPTPQ